MFVKGVRLAVLLAAVSVWVWIAGAAGWLPRERTDPVAGAAFKAACVVAVLACVLRVLAPILRAVRGTRCPRCGAPAARGTVYCLDHEKQAIDEIRDRTRASLLNERPSRG